MVKQSNKQPRPCDGGKEAKMGFASYMNRVLAENFWKNATEEEKKLLKAGKFKEVKDKRNEYWTPGFQQWLEAIAKGSK